MFTQLVWILTSRHGYGVGSCFTIARDLSHTQGPDVKVILIRAGASPGKSFDFAEIGEDCRELSQELRWTGGWRPKGVLTLIKLGLVTNNRKSQEPDWGRVKQVTSHKIFNGKATTPGVKWDT